jgi:SAM-dependent methyltransferase
MTPTSMVSCVERSSYFRGHLYVDGWAFHPTHRVRSAFVRLPSGQLMKAAGYGISSPDVAAHHGDRAKECRFSFRVAIADPQEAREASLVFGLGGRTRAVVEGLSGRLAEDPFQKLFPKFHALVASVDAPVVVEIGSRARSGNVNVSWLPEDATYVGFDVIEGPNVDIVGDAHELSRFFPAESVDAIFSVSTVEHLAMPWKVALEMNSVLKTGGIMYAGTHQSWPLHDEPWDFWRFSEYTWSALFNAATGFEITDVVMGERASIVADLMSAATAGLDAQPAYLGSSVIARKIGPTSLRWEVDPQVTLRANYPA